MTFKVKYMYEPSVSNVYAQLWVSIDGDKYQLCGNITMEQRAWRVFKEELNKSAIFLIEKEELGDALEHAGESSS